MQQVLFVDDDLDVLAGLRRQLSPLRKEFGCHFAVSGREALECMAKEPISVVVSDMRMPGMDGAALLNEVRVRHPHVIRVVLSGQSDPREIAASVQTTHQYLSKPCEPAVLRATILRCVGLQEQTLDDSLQEVISSLPSLPSLPDTYLELVDAIEDPASSVADVAAIVGRDIGMTAKVLQLVNSAFFGLRRRVSSVHLAVAVLGLETLRALTLTIQVFQRFDTKALRRFGLGDVVDHGLQVGFLARHLASRHGCCETVCDDSLTAGLLHDVGKLLLATGRPEEYCEALDLAAAEGLAAQDAEQEVLGATHADVGGYLLGVWGLPEEVVSAVAWHHEPWRAADRVPAAHSFVHGANALTNQLATEDDPPPDLSLDWHYLREAGLDGDVEDWSVQARSLLAVGGA